MFKSLRNYLGQIFKPVTAEANLCDRMQFSNLAAVNHGLIYQEFLNTKLIKMCLALVITLCVCLSCLVLLAMQEEKRVYFGVNQAMQILPMHPLDAPIHSDQALKSWAAQATIDIFNLDFVHFREQLANTRQYFTKQAFASFSQSLNKEGHLKILAQYRALMHGVATGPPIIIAKGILDHCMTWEIEVPFQLAYETSEKVLSNQHFVVRLRIKRVSTAEYVQGIAISQMIVVKTTKFQDKL